MSVSVDTAILLSRLSIVILLGLDPALMYKCIETLLAMADAKAYIGFNGAPPSHVFFVDAASEENDSAMKALIAMASIGLVQDVDECGRWAITPAG
jgi:hypothetical protein